MESAISRESEISAKIVARNRGRILTGKSARRPCDELQSYPGGYQDKPKRGDEPRSADPIIVLVSAPTALAGPARRWLIDHMSVGGG